MMSFSASPWAFPEAVRKETTEITSLERYKVTTFNLSKY